MELSNLFTFLVPPVAGAIIGYFTNDIAIKMLFRPYKAIYLGKRKLPFTPGLIPANQERLAKRVSDTIMGSLLTPDEIQNLAKRLLEPTRVRGAIFWLLQSALNQIRSDKEQKTAKILAGILQDLFQESLPRILKALSRKEDFLQEQINQIFDQILLEFRLNETQARQLSDWFLDVVLPADILRLALVDFLSDRNIQVLDEGIREKTSGTYWVVANLFGVRNTLIRLRGFCLDEKEIANTRLKELILSLELRNRIRKWLQELSLQNLPVSTVRQLRKTTSETVRSYLQAKGGDFFQNLGQSIKWDDLSVLIVKRMQSSEAVSNSLEIISQEFAQILERYLEKDLEKIVTEAIPILAIDQVIIDKVKSTSPAELELAVQGIVKSELQGIVNLGGVLGFIVGLLQIIVLLFGRL